MFYQKCLKAHYQLYLNMNQAELENLISELVKFGEDKEELEIWLKVFPDLEASEQEELLRNLQSELEHLKKINGN